MTLNSGVSTVVLNLNPSIRLEHWYSEDTVTVHRGALMYSLPVTGNYTILQVHPFDSRDYQVLPMTEWRYALVVSFVGVTRSKISPIILPLSPLA